MRYALLTGITMLTATLGAGAEPQAAHRDPAVPSFQSLDLDGDGVIGPGEASAHRGLVELLPYYDRDGDGRLDAEEFRALLEDAARAGDMLEAGRITQ